MLDAIILFTIATVGISSVVTLFFVEYREKKDSWHGTLIDKKLKSYTYKGKTFNHYILTFQKSSGKKVNYYVSRRKYNTFQVGDRVNKSKTKNFPELEKGKEVYGVQTP